MDFENQKFIKITSILFVIFMAFSFPLISANIYYQDDLIHTFYNPGSWLSDGRPLAYGLMHLLGPFRPLDSAPWPQILGLALVALTLGRLGKSHDMAILPCVLSSAFLICQPFYLENLSYRYDSFFMSVSICLALLPFINKNRQEPGYKRILKDAGCLFLLMNTYQASLDIFICFSLIESVLIIRNDRISEAIRNIYYRFITLIAAYFAYKIEVLLFIHTNEYAQFHSLLVRSPAELYGNVVMLLGQFKEYFWGGFYESLLVVFVVVSFAMNMMGRKGTGAGRSLRFTGIALTVVLYAGILSCFFGLQLLLRHPVPAPRTFIGFGAILGGASFFFLADRKFQSVRDRICFVCVGFLLAQGIFQAAAYTNAIRAQTTLREDMSLQIINDISDLTSHAARPNPDIAGRYWLWGTIGHEPLARLAKRSYRYYPSLRGSIMSQPFMDRYLVSPIFMYDILEKNGLSDTVDFLSWRLWKYKDQYRSTPAWKLIEKSIHQCSFDGMKEHAAFNTYKIGRYIITDYNKTCSRGAVVTMDM
ncbi:glucosyltransferase domain-containing protein [Komagataeibacter xylinus]|uniref:Uncharacterized protein n=1 Tax=Komagataeibacter xylinus TaxID=28448 RepID=A0A857FNR0_KOMXY|nr:glucosyltransferase domain-containing protein [Komagataeibacter xylinus]QHC34870.1 hypothetical protein FMA36_04570 [Komagataeibacter xylinus]